MSSSHFIKQAENPGMEGWKGLHVGDVPCYRDKKRHKKYRYGAKKGLRRARRRLDKKVVKEELEN